MEKILNNLQFFAKKDEKKNKSFFSHIKKNTPKNLDVVVHDIHGKVFKQINCLSCANCCKTLGPRITDKDIARISKYFKIRPSEFSEKYLRTDMDNDYVFKKMPCVFLSGNNCCSIYDVRPTACRNYPHTERKKFVQLLDITLKNIAVCPGVFEIVNEMRKVFKQ